MMHLTLGCENIPIFWPFPWLELSLEIPLCFFFFCAFKNRNIQKPIRLVEKTKLFYLWAIILQKVSYLLFTSLCFSCIHLMIVIDCI